MPCYELTPQGVNGLREFSTTSIATLPGQEVLYDFMLLGGCKEKGWGCGEVIETSGENIFWWVVIGPRNSLLASGALPEPQFSQRRKGRQKLRRIGRADAVKQSLGFVL